MHLRRPRPLPALTRVTAAARPGSRCRRRARFHPDGGAGLLEGGAEPIGTAFREVVPHRPGWIGQMPYRLAEIQPSVLSQPGGHHHPILTRVGDERGAWFLRGSPATPLACHVGHSATSAPATKVRPRWPTAARANRGPHRPCLGCCPRWPSRPPPQPGQRRRAGAPLGAAARLVVRARPPAGPAPGPFGRDSRDQNAPTLPHAMRNAETTANPPATRLRQRSQPPVIPLPRGRCNPSGATLA